MTLAPVSQVRSLMPGHIIVCGEDALAIRIIHELGEPRVFSPHQPPVTARHPGLSLLQAARRPLSASHLR